MDERTATASLDASVIIPAFRAAGFIARAIDSALSQQGVRLEVIVIDDACPLGTADAVRSQYGDRDDLRLIRLPRNQGPSAARNAGFRAARGEWIAILDADDAFDEGRLERLLAVGRRLNADVIADNVRYFEATSGTLSQPKIKSVTAPLSVDLHKLVARGRPGAGELDYGLLKPAFRRAFLDDKPLYPTDVRHGEDFLFYFSLIRAGARFFVVPETGYQWTLRSSGNSQTTEDYLGQARDTRELQRADGVRGDSKVVQLLEARARALVKLHHERRFERDLSERRYLGVLKSILQHPPLAARLARRIIRRRRN